MLALTLTHTALVVGRIKYVPDYGICELPTPAAWPLRLRRGRPEGAVEHRLRLSGVDLLGGALLAQKDQSGGWTDYIQADGKLLAKNGPAGLYYYHTDNLGSTRQLIPAANILAGAAWDYAPFGQDLFNSGYNEVLTFTGQQTDYESGLQYLGALYYSANQGRFLSPDWADKPEAVPYSDLTDPQSLNLYGTGSARTSLAKCMRL
ncbi:MAG: RHS repeat-associated core domain-containing protein [Acidobacteriaceae bacterium]